VPKRRQDLASRAKDSRLDPVVMFHLVFLLLTLAESWFLFLFCEKGGLFFFIGLVLGGSIMAERVLSYKNCLIPPLVLVLLTTTFSTMSRISISSRANDCLRYRGDGKRQIGNQLIPPLKVIDLWRARMPTSHQYSHAEPFDASSVHLLHHLISIVTSNLINDKSSRNTTLRHYQVSASTRVQAQGPSTKPRLHLDQYGHLKLQHRCSLPSTQKLLHHQPLQSLS